MARSDGAAAHCHDSVRLERHGRVLYSVGVGVELLPIWLCANRACISA